MLFNENAVKLGAKKFSYSKLSTGKSCAYLFNKQYIERAAPSNKVNASPAQIGIAVHSVMELAMAYIVARDLDISDVDKYMDVALTEVSCKQGLTSYELDMIYSMRSAARSKLVRLATFAKKTGCKVFVEAALAINQDLSPSSFRDPSAFFNGKLDLVLVKPSGDVAIIDHKTGKRRDGAYTDQLCIYEILTLYGMSQTLSAQGIEIKSIKTGLNYLSEDEIVWYPGNSVETIRGPQTETFVNMVNKTADYIVSNEANKGDHCKYCSYKTSCWAEHGWGRKRKAKEEKPAVLDV